MSAPLDNIQVFGGAKEMSNLTLISGQIVDFDINFGHNNKEYTQFLGQKYIFIFYFFTKFI